MNSRLDVGFLAGKMEARFWWEINFRLVVIGLVGILIFILSLGLSFIPSLGSIGSMLFRVTVILALVGLYELIVRKMVLFVEQQRLCSNVASYI